MRFGKSIVAGLALTAFSLFSPEGIKAQDTGSRSDSTQVHRMSGIGVFAEADTPEEINKKISLNPVDAHLMENPALTTANPISSAMAEDVYLTSQFETRGFTILYNPTLDHSLRPAWNNCMISYESRRVDAMNPSADAALGIVTNEVEDLSVELQPIQASLSAGVKGSRARASICGDITHVPAFYPEETKQALQTIGRGPKLQASFSIGDMDKDNGVISGECYGSDQYMNLANEFDVERFEKWNKQGHCSMEGDARIGRNLFVTGRVNAQHGYNRTTLTKARPEELPPEAEFNNLETLEQDVTFLGQSWTLEHEHIASASGKVYHLKRTTFSGGGQYTGFNLSSQLNSEVLANLFPGSNFLTSLKPELSFRQNHSRGEVNRSWSAGMSVETPHLEFGFRTGRLYDDLGPQRITDNLVQNDSTDLFSAQRTRFQEGFLTINFDRETYNRDADHSLTFGIKNQETTMPYLFFNEIDIVGKSAYASLTGRTRHVNWMLSGRYRPDKRLIIDGEDFGLPGSPVLEGRAMASLNFPNWSVGLWGIARGDSYIPLPNAENVRLDKSIILSSFGRVNVSRVFGIGNGLEFAWDWNHMLGMLAGQEIVMGVYDKDQPIMMPDTPNFKLTYTLPISTILGIDTPYSYNNSR